MRRNSTGFIQILLIIILVPVVIAAAYVAKKHVPSFQPKPKELEERPISPSLFEELLKKGKGFPTPTITPKLSPKPTPTPKPGSRQISQPTPSPTLTPRIPNPPIINISYPSEMQSIEMGNNQNFCVVDTPAGGDTSGLKRRHDINDGGWSSYTNIFTLCFDPKEGLNRVSLRYKNSYGDESVIYTRQFNFHRIQYITVTYSGQVYRDANCNGIKDSGESGVGSVTINFFQMPQWYLIGTVTSDGNGNYSFSKTIKENESVTLKPGPVSPSGYKSNPNFDEPSITLNSSNRTTNQNLPQVPNENVGLCQ